MPQSVGPLRRPTPPAASAAISQTAIAGATLGRPSAVYKTLFGGYRESTIAGPGYDMLAFQQPEVAVYFPSRGKGAIIITTWNKQLPDRRGASGRARPWPR